LNQYKYVTICCDLL